VGPLRREEVGAIVAALRQAPAVYRAAGMLLLYTGMRRGEALGLQWEDIDLGAGTIAVRRARLRTAKGEVVGSPKTSSGNRVVPIHPTLLDELAAWRRVQLEERLAAGPAWKGGEWVLARARGPVSPWSLSTWWSGFAKRAGVDARLHDLRHTAATLMAAAGVPPRVLAEMLGARDGLGYLLWSAWQTFSVSSLWATLFVTAILGFVSVQLVDFLRKVLVPWQRTSSRA
jgi:integrase